MAKVWANANGNWGTTSIWDYWDENTQSIQPYLQVPQVGDYVYANGYIITIPANSIINIGNGTLSNGDNPHTNRNGGTFFFKVAGNYSITANIEGYGYSTTLGNKDAVVNTGRITVINGNITSYADNGTFVVRCGGYNGARTEINGNLIGSYCLGLDWVANPLTINGNVVNDTPNRSIQYDFSGGSSSSENITINGSASNNFIAWHGTILGSFNLTINGNYTHTEQSQFNKTLNTFIVGGNFINKGSLLTCTTFRIGVGIYYVSTNNTTGFRATTFTILNPSLFVWKDITEPRSNPFIILTDADMNNRQQYPPENEVKEGTEYVWGEKVGTYQAPPESVVLKDFVYDNGDKVGTLENQTQVGCVTKEDVREGVELIGLQEFGTLVVPSVDDVREGVVFDNGSVGTLIVEGGGVRLRIANFGYYTDSQSDTYIVDLTEQDKPKFAVAEERVLIEMFPELDLGNIPEKYFDDLFVKYLKYRLIVEYYRTAGINSTFSTSEPTTEIVNYRNVNCEIWMNIANTYLKAWGVKYPNSIKKQRILL